MTLGAARVIWSINDLSAFIDAMIKGYVMMVIRAERGPIGYPQLITSMDEYRRVFGKKVDYTTDPLVCEMALRLGARLILVRTAHYEDAQDSTSLTALSSHLTVKDRGEIPTHGRITGTATGSMRFTPAQSGRVTGTELQNFTFGTGTSDKLKIKVGAQGADQTVTLSGTNRSAFQVATDINTATTDLTATAVNGKVMIAADLITNAVQIKSVANDAYSVLGLLEDVYAATAGTDKLVLSVDAGTDQTFTLLPATNIEGPFKLTAYQVASQLHTLTGAHATSINGSLRIETISTGSDASIQVQGTSTAHTVIGMNTSIHYGLTSTAFDTLQFDAANPGDWGNDLLIQVSESALNPEDRFNVKVMYGRQGELDEYYGDMSMDPTDSRYVEVFINERSKLINVTDLHSANQAPSNMPAVNLWGAAMAEGFNGLDDFDDADWIGNQAEQTGMYAMDNAPYMAMDLMIPGTTSVVVYQAMIAYAESRGDIITYGQVPAGMTPEETVDWREGNAPWSHPAFNSHRFAIYYGKPLVYDDLDNSTKYISCLGHFASVLCKTDTNYDESYAPAGPRRGPVGLVLGIDTNIQGYRSTGYADMFAEYGINYLMISHYVRMEGAMFWEQRTSQRASSSLQYLNVVRFITMISRVLIPSLRMYLFDPNHPVTWRQIYRMLKPFFENCKNRYQIYDYVIQCDENAYFDGGVLKNAIINTGLDMQQGIYHARALIQPTLAIEYLEFTLGVVRTGEAFEDFTPLQTLPGWIRS